MKTFAVEIKGRVVYKLTLQAENLDAARERAACQYVSERGWFCPDFEDGSDGHQHYTFAPQEEWIVKEIEARKYRVVMWCRDCGNGEDPAGCFGGDEETVQHAACCDVRGTVLFDSFEAAEEAGDKETEDPPWDYRIETLCGNGKWNVVTK